MSSSISLHEGLYEQVLNGCRIWNPWNTIPLSNRRKISVIDIILWTSTSPYSEYVNYNLYQRFIPRKHLSIMPRETLNQKARFLLWNTEELPQKTIRVRLEWYACSNFHSHINISESHHNNLIIIWNNSDTQIQELHQWILKKNAGYMSLYVSIGQNTWIIITNSFSYTLFKVKYQSLSLKLEHSKFFNYKIYQPPNPLTL